MKKGILKIFAAIAMLGFLVFGCGGAKSSVEIPTEEKEIFNKTGQDTISIGSEESDYEIIIVDPGFNLWLQTIARPEGYYEQSFLENRNNIMVINWNQRVIQPSRFDPNLYLLRIDYDSKIDYGYEINYKLYNYFIYFQRKYNQRLGPWRPRI